MLRFKRVSVDEAVNLRGYNDRTVFQTVEWLRFVAETQKAEPVLAALVDESDQVVGRFTGLIVRKGGVKILGSPFPGWTTSYMGFNLDPSIARFDALIALEHFAFGELGCFHLEIMDRFLTKEDFDRAGYKYRFLNGFEIDLGLDEDTLFKNMKPACRRCIRKADKSGVQLEIATDLEFAVDYHEQLTDVYAKQSLVPTYSSDRVRSLIQNLMPTGQLLLVRARDPQGVCIATGVFPALNDTMYFWGGASWRAHQGLRPNEAIMWFAMQYWKERGIEAFDMGGGGEYKRKYGGSEIAIPWGRKSKYYMLENFRNLAQTARSTTQRLAFKQ